MEQSCYAITVRSRPITDITTKPSAEVYVTIALNLNLYDKMLQYRSLSGLKLNCGFPTVQNKPLNG